MSERCAYIPEEYLPAIDQLPGDLYQIAQAVEEEMPGHGVRVAILLGQLFPGVPLYIRNIDEIVRRIRNDAIMQEYDSGTVTRKTLAIKYRLSTRTIDRILDEEQPSQDVLKNRQMKLF